MASVRFALVGVCYISEEHAIITTNTNKHSTKKHTQELKIQPNTQAQRKTNHQIINKTSSFTLSNEESGN